MDQIPLEEIKEEPLDDDCFPQEMPKLEPMFDVQHSPENFEKILKSIFGQGFPECSHVVKEEPFEDVNEEHTELKIPKLEVLDDVYSPGESSESLKSTSSPESFLNVIQKFYMKTQQQLKKVDPSEVKCNDMLVPNAFKKCKLGDPYGFQFLESPKDQLSKNQLEITMKSQLSKLYYNRSSPIQRARRNAESSFSRLCCLCREEHFRHTVRSLRTEEEKFIMMIGWLLFEKITAKEAHLFLSESAGKWTCRSHFVDVPLKIFEFLQINAFHEIHSSQLLDELMIYSNALRPKVTKVLFCAILNDFCQKNRYVTGADNKLNVFLKNRLPSLRTRFDFFCSLCSKNQSLLLKVISEDEKLICVIGSVLRGTCSLSRARQIVGSKNCCVNHYSEAIFEIQNALKISSMDQLDTCSVDLMNCLMVVVHSLCPEVSTTQFLKILKHFAEKRSRIAST